MTINTLDITLDINEVTTAYFEAALWSSTDDNGEPLEDNYDIFDIAESAKQEQLSEIKDWLSYCDEQGLLQQFIEQHESGRYTVEEMLGHDFWLTRNGHGAGFWDRDLGGLGQKLTDTCKKYGECDPVIADDGLIYFY